MDIILHDPVLIMALLGLGVLAGFLAGLLGIGGGAVLVPGLFAVFTLINLPENLVMHMAVGTSLAIIVPTGLSSAYAHWKRGAVDMLALSRIGPGILAGSLLGVWVAERLTGAHLSLIFAVAIGLLALVMLSNPARFRLFDKLPPRPLSALAGLVIGTISSLIGIGGATLSVPFLSLCAIPIHRAIGTAAALGLFISIPAALGFAYIGWGAALLPAYALGYVYVPAWGIILLTSVVCAPLGAAAAHKLPVKAIRTGFAVFMVLVAVKMAQEVWFQ